MIESDFKEKNEQKDIIVDSGSSLDESISLELQGNETTDKSEKSESSQPESSQEELVESENFKLASESSLLQATLESTADGLLVVNRSGKIISYNDKFRRMWCIPKDLMEEENDERAIKH